MRISEVPEHNLLWTERERGGDDAPSARSLARPCSTTRISRWGKALRCHLQPPPRFFRPTLAGFSAAGRVTYQLGTSSSDTHTARGRFTQSSTCRIASSSPRRLIKTHRTRRTCTDDAARPGRADTHSMFKVEPPERRRVCRYATGGACVGAPPNLPPFRGWKGCSRGGIRVGAGV
ncbi:hypothetical protein BD626DRAFT_99879 [Schizophyllum amplum]|uniref:Uncharacterized protein n=1 Tax=Schizophyllum amplum TaxID=97359 RepID=A0A550CRD3_9AGAR|nr:hypothetical protein BD626DRAFT_99879 [Auriculariopsis ampla]